MNPDTMIYPDKCRLLTVRNIGDIRAGFPVKQRSFRAGTVGEEYADKLYEDVKPLYRRAL